MIGEQRNHIAVATEHILGKSLQRLLRSNFNEHASAGIVQRAQALNKLHGRSDLLRENVQHLRHDVRPRGIKLAVCVRDDWQTGRFQMQALQNSPQRLAGSGHNRGVEGMADGQCGHVIASFLEGFHGLLDRLARATDDSPGGCC